MIQEIGNTILCTNACTPHGNQTTNRPILTVGTLLQSLGKLVNFISLMGIQPIRQTNDHLIFLQTVIRMIATLIYSPLDGV